MSGKLLRVEQLLGVTLAWITWAGMDWAGVEFAGWWPVWMIRLS